MTTRRGFLLGLGAALAAPVVVRSEILMPVRRIIDPFAPRIGTMYIDTEEKLLRMYGGNGTWQVLGKQIAMSIEDSLNREGFMRRVLSRGDVDPGNVPKIRIGGDREIKAVFARG